MMTLKTIRETKKEALEFVSRANTVIDLMTKYILNSETNKTSRDCAAVWLTISCKETGALRRQSMELTRVLAELRRFKQ